MSLDPRKLASRDPGAARAFMHLIRRLVRRYVRDTSRLREITQSAFAEILRKLRDGPPPTTRRVVQWTSNSAINALRRELRRARRRAISYESQLHGLPLPDPTELLAARQKIERIETLLEQLAERDRMALLARAYGDSNAEAAARLGLTRAAVRSSVSRTRKRLRLSLSAQELRDALDQVTASHHEGRSTVRLRGSS